MENNNSFLGRGWAFPVSFTQGSDIVEMAEDEENIRQSLRVLLSTMRRERVMLPDFGTDLKDLLFESLSTSTGTALTGRIEQAILFFEPRIILDGITYDQDTAQGVIKLDLEYTIVATNTRTNLVFPFYINEGTDIG
ncbi:MAG: GPW/gp25 family protein [Bacteroidota bacterium]